MNKRRRVTTPQPLILPTLETMPLEIRRMIVNFVVETPCWALPLRFVKPLASAASAIDPATRVFSSTYAYMRDAYDLEQYNLRNIYEYRPVLVLAEEAVKCGLRAIVRWCCRTLNLRYLVYKDSHLACAAVVARDLSILKWLLQRQYCTLDKRVCDYAAVVGDLTILRWLRSDRISCAWDTNVVECAAAVGNLNVVSWCFENDAPIDSMAAERAACRGHVDVLEYLWTIVEPVQPHTFKYYCILEAARCGSIASLVWFQEKYASSEHMRSILLGYITMVWYHAAQYGQFELLKWGYDNGYDLEIVSTPRLANGTAMGGHLEVLQWLLSIGAPFDRNEFVNWMVIMMGSSTITTTKTLEKQRQVLAWLDNR